LAESIALLSYQAPALSAMPGVPPVVSTVTAMSNVTWIEIAPAALK